MNLTTILRTISYYLLPIGLATATIAFPIGSDFYIEIGGLALGLILLNLFLKPIAVITKIKPLMRMLAYRREIGVASFWLFLFHAGGLMWKENLTDPTAYLDPASYLFWGALGGIGMIILGITSNNVSVRLLKRNWKRIQYIAYPILLFSLIHAALAENEGLLGVAGITLIFIVLKYFERKRMKG